NIHLHVGVERDWHAHRSQREIVRLVDVDFRQRVDAETNIRWRMAEQRLERRRDAVRLVEIVVGEDRDAHHATSSTPSDGRATRPTGGFGWRGPASTKGRGATARGRAMSGSASKPPASTA